MLPPPVPEGEADLSLSASFVGSNQPVRSGLSWRIFEDKGETGRPAIIARSTDAAPTLKLRRVPTSPP